MNRRLRTAGAALLLVAAAAVLPGGAAAAPPDRFALGTFHPAPAGDRFFQVESPDVLGHGAWDARLVADVAAFPFRSPPDKEGEGPLPAAEVPLQVFFHAGGAVTLWDRWKLSVDVPFGVTRVANDIDAPTGQTSSNWALGDVRAGVRFRVGGEPGDGFRLALAGHVWIPTGDAGSFAGEGKARGGPRLVLGGRAGKLTWGTSGGFVFRPHAEVAGAAMDSQFVLDGGVSARFSSALQLVIESHGALVIKGKDAPSSRTTNLEMLLGWRTRIGDVVVGPAAGFGGLGGAGSPVLRGLLELSYAPLERLDARLRRDPVRIGPAPAPRDDDPDGDGVMRWEDACPDTPGPVNGCPDADGDGIADKDDACPARPGVAGRPGDGCPVYDIDGDGIPDTEDACPELPGARSEISRDNGCPGDADGDGVFDDDDACPDVPGRFSMAAEKNGCPEEEPAAEQAPE